MHVGVDAPFTKVLLQLCIPGRDNSNLNRNIPNNYPAMLFLSYPAK